MTLAINLCQSTPRKKRKEDALLDFVKAEAAREEERFKASNRPMKHRQIDSLTFLKNFSIINCVLFMDVIQLAFGIGKLRGPGQMFGYRTMWLTLKHKHGLHVKRETVMRMLRELNPLGTLSRTRSRFVRRTYHSMGPNYVWHVDRYDKLKMFGIGISGCINGFSRKIMWLKCGPTNKNPEVIKNNFIDCINVLSISDHSDYYTGAKSHMFGSSMSNYEYRTTDEHQCLLRFCFMTVLQADLVEWVHLWNRHRIRPSRLASCPGGIPNELYSLTHR
ncbi:hypothetical protein F7725_012445 [Dissostichus mawsoni]|uniref:Integrase core domain-containing protein n=1 Tax=Dissostichus mawsoni TaxID=36200 RepID=A0A7J5YNH2_DISMA|nr:hypothetical protein F7725_012445 [Dissostichus mawsoni]